MSANLAFEFRIRQEDEQGAGEEFGRQERGRKGELRRDTCVSDGGGDDSRGNKYVLDRRRATEWGKVCKRQARKRHV
jgi:hypothetical protein